jgi:hypothetical protein
MIKKVFSPFDKYRQLMPLLLLTILTIITLTTFVIGEVGNNAENRFILTFKHYGGFTILLINYLIYFYSRKHFKIIVGITLIMGLFNLINFNASQISTFIGIGNLKLGCQPYIFIICFVTYILNRKSVNNLLGELFGPSPEQTIQRQEKYEIETIQKFMDKYQSYSNEQLENILADKRYVSEALEASKRILDQRKNK